MWSQRRALSLSKPLRGCPVSGGYATVAAALAATVAGTSEADWLVAGAGAVWRVLLHLSGSSGALDLTASGDGTYAATDSDDRSVDLVVENAANADTLAITSEGIEAVISGGTKTTGLRVDMTGLAGWNARKRTWVAVRITDIFLGNNSDRIHLQIVDAVSGSMTRQLSIPLQRNGASDYRLDLYHYNGSGYDFENTGLLAADGDGNHWLVAEITPGRVVARGDLDTSSGLPAGPTASTKRSEADYYGAGHSTTETTVDALCGVLRIQLQTTGASESSVTFADVYVLQEGS